MESSNHDRTSPAPAGTSAPRPRLLMVTHESLGEKMAGPGIRTWEIARALGRAGVQVTVATAFPTARSAENVRFMQFAWEHFETIRALLAGSDVLMATGMIVSRIIRELGGPVPIPVVVDNYDIVEIEGVMLAITQQRFDFDPTPAYVEEMFNALRQGDYFVVALESQFDYLIGALTAAGRINQTTIRNDLTAARLLGRLPLGLPDEPPIRGPNRMRGVLPGVGENDRVLFWGGGIWDWFDPLTLMDALSEVIRVYPDARMVFGSLHHFSQELVPHMSVAARLMERVEKAGWLNRHVYFLDWVPYDQRGSVLLEADLGVSLSLPTIETRYAIRARLLDYLWAGLPCVLTRGDEMANALGRAGLADLTEPHDVEGVTRAILRRLEDPASGRDQARAQAHELAESLRWSRCVVDLRHYLEHPYLAADAAAARASFGNMLPLQQAWEDLRHENIALKEEIAMLRRRKVVRIADALGERFHRLRGR